MSKDKRLKTLLNYLENSTEPVSANQLASYTNVSRQLIVGDIALLRASGHRIIANHLGYTLNPKQMRHQKQIVCKHTPDKTQLELEIFVKHHCKVVNVIIEHPSYGSIIGELNISTQDDIIAFIQQENPLISTLTDGVHIHTIEYDNLSDLEAAIQSLKKHNILYT